MTGSSTSPCLSAPRESGELMAVIVGFLDLLCFNIFFKAVVIFQKCAKGREEAGCGGVPKVSENQLCKNKV